MTLSLSPRLAFREALRRLTGRPYRYNGVPVGSSADFRLLRSALKRGLRVWGDGEQAYFETGFGLLVVPRPRLASTFDDLDDYGVLDVEGRSVLDVGAYIGDSVLYFLSRGARVVYAYEPLYHEIAWRNVEANGASDRVVLVAKGVYYKRGRVCVKENYEASGLEKGDKCFEVVPLEDAIREHRPDTAKLDCEGCEYSILATPCSALRRVSEWVVEIHGAEGVILDYMSDCGFSHSLVRRRERLVSVYHFTLA